MIFVMSKNKQTGITCMKMDMRIVLDINEEVGVTYMTVSEIGFFGLQKSSGFVESAIISRKEDKFSSVCCGGRCESDNYNDLFGWSVKTILDKYGEYKENSREA